MLVHPVEDQRREQRGEQPADDAARRHDQIEKRQVPRARAEMIEIAVERDRDGEEHREAGERDHHRPAA